MWNLAVAIEKVHCLRHYNPSKSMDLTVGHRDIIFHPFPHTVLFSFVVQLSTFYHVYAVSNNIFIRANIGRFKNTYSLIDNQKRLLYRQINK